MRGAVFHHDVSSRFCSVTVLIKLLSVWIINYTCQSMVVNGNYMCFRHFVPERNIFVVSSAS